LEKWGKLHLEKRVLGKLAEDLGVFFENGLTTGVFLGETPFKERAQGWAWDFSPRKIHRREAQSPL